MFTGDHMKKFILLSAVSLTFIGCATTEPSHTPHWGYTGHEGPEHWGNLSPEFTTCKSGKNQSPVDIDTAVKAQLTPLHFAYTAAPTEILNNGHTIQVNIDSGSFIEVDGKRFALKQFHFHTPSENTVNGQFYAMEGHFVHADEAGNLAVIGVMFKEGAENASLARFWPQIPQTSGQQVSLQNTAQDYVELLPASKEYYQFSGSLTTPPCSEGVRWYVLKQPLSVSKAQVQTFLDVLHHPNNRPVQALNARTVLE